VNPLESFSFIHAADLHLGYSQYGLEARREDFDRTFEELVKRAIEIKPDFVIIAGDIFHHARPSNVTLENAIRNFGRLRDVGIPVLTVDGSHDSAPNTVTGTILNPLDSAGLIYHLPRHEGACWRKPDRCYVYGVPNFRTKQKTGELLPAFMQEKRPMPDSSVFNIFVFHMALDLPAIKPPFMEAEASPDLVPEGFDYYAGGHVHKAYDDKFKTGRLVYAGCVETVDYEEAENSKGFYHVKVDEMGHCSTEFVRLESPRRFMIMEQDFSGLISSKITERAVQLVKEADEDGVIIVPILKGLLPVGANRSEVDVGKIRSAAKRSLLVHPIMLLRESQVSEEAIRSIFEGELKDLKTKAFEYFLHIFSERYNSEQADRIAHAAINLIEPLIKNQEEKVRETLEGLVQ
jgi:DNA repair exonuclease SbcCD nuclease subunit